MSTEITKQTTTFLYDVEHKGKLYKLVQEDDHILSKTNYWLFDIRDNNITPHSQIEDDELLDEILSNVILPK